MIYSPLCASCSRRGGRSSRGSGTPGVLWAQLPYHTFSAVPDSKLPFQCLCPRESHPSPPQETFPAGSLLCMLASLVTVTSFPPAGLHHHPLVPSCPQCHLDQVNPVWSSLFPPPGALWNHWTVSTSWEYACLALGKAGTNSDLPCE